MSLELGEEKIPEITVRKVDRTNAFEVHCQHGQEYRVTWLRECLALKSDDSVHSQPACERFSISVVEMLTLVPEHADIATRISEALDLATQRIREARAAAGQ